jgi:hypothetical protein
LRYVVAAFLFLSPSFAEAQSTSEVQSACRKFDGGVEDLGDGRFKMPSNFSSGYCWGIFMTLWDLVRREPYQDFLLFCPPREATPYQYIKIFLKFTDEHPQDLHYSASSTALVALRQAFPCQKSSH